MGTSKEYRKYVFVTLLYCILIFTIKKAGIFFMPDEDKMVEFQFNMITVSTVFAGFSFTVLGILLGMFSEPMMEKLKDTSIVTRKSKKLMRSVIYICGSGILSLLFIVKSDRFIISYVPKANSIIEYLFISCIFFLLMGIINFVASTLGVFQLIEKIYGYNRNKYNIKAKEYQEEMKKAKEQLDS